MILWSPHQPGGECFYNGHPKAKDAFKVCPTPDGVPRTKSSILLTIRIHQIWWKVTGLPTTLDAFNAIPRPNIIPWSQIIIINPLHSLLLVPRQFLYRSTIRSHQTMSAISLMATTFLESVAGWGWIASRNNWSTRQWGAIFLITYILHTLATFITFLLHLIHTLLHTATITRDLIH
jgi:hypothetical protein